ncbi:MAG: DegT/DnrJ/EryC1/StrS family aminotransferase [Chloroflexota bacterium]
MNTKSYIEDLAILGGTPAFADHLHVGRPNIGSRDNLFARINDIFDRRWLTNNGPMVQEFERQLAAHLHVKHCVAVCNGTIGLEIAIRALDLTGEVIMPAMTFIATAHALRWQGIKPVFADVLPGSHNLDPNSVANLITPRTTGILGVHLWGIPCAVDALTELAETHHLKLLFDAAHAFGCSYQDQMIGNFGDAEVFSFHATKFCNSLEGGAIATNNDELAAKMRSMRDFGFVEQDFTGYVGTNGKMNEVSAAMGLTSLESVDTFIETNYRNYKTYQQALAGVPGIRFVRYDESQQNNYQYIILEVDPYEAGISRDELVTILKAEHVLARRYFYPGCHRMEPYLSDPATNHDLPLTECVVSQTMGLPTGTAITQDAIRQICAIIRLVVAQAAHIRPHLMADPAVLPAL